MLLSIILYKTKYFRSQINNIDINNMTLTVFLDNYKARKIGKNPEIQ